MGWGSGCEVSASGAWLTQVGSSDANKKSSGSGSAAFGTVPPGLGDAEGCDFDGPQGGCSAVVGAEGEEAKLRAYRKLGADELACR